MITIQEQNFGVEIELAGAPRRAIAEAVATALDARITATHRSGYDATIVTDQQGREWKIMNDSSIPIINGYKGSEIVTPILSYNDIETLQAVVRKVRTTGASAPSSGCGIHCHVDSQMHTPQSLSRLAKMIYKNEDLIFEALKVHPQRRRYTRPMNEDFINKVAENRPNTDRTLNEQWFGHYTPHPQRYDSKRYAGLNLNNRWRDLGTIEFRYFNMLGTIHAGKIKAYVQFCLALSARALNARSASHKKIQTDNPKYNFRVWLVSTLGMKGDEFKTARYHLTRYLPGNSAWRYGPPTISNNNANS